MFLLTFVSFFWTDIYCVFDVERYDRCDRNCNANWQRHCKPNLDLDLVVILFYFSIRLLHRLGSIIHSFRYLFVQFNENNNNLELLCQRVWRARYVSASCR